MTSILDILPGIIWSGFLGLAIGNFATNPIYRLPRNENLFARDPYCGDCNAPLLPRDLFPVFSWLSTKGKCRYCGAKVPGEYTVVEALAGLWFILCYLKFGFSEPYVLLSLGGVSLMMIAAMEAIDNFFSERTLVASMMLGMIYRTLMDGTIYGFSAGIYVGVMAGALVWKFSGKPMARSLAAFPPYLKLLALAGVWLHALPMTVLLVCCLFLAAVRKYVHWKIDVTLITMIIVLLLQN